MAVQGFGNVGYWAARFLADAGCRIVAVSDVEGTLRCAEGLDIEALSEAAENNGSIMSYQGAECERFHRDELLTSDCDILVPAALGGAIHAYNAGDIQARLIAEGANHPTTPEADEILLERGITVLPDIYANAGGVTVSYFEWVQNQQHVRWDGERVDNALKKIMNEAFDAINAACEEFDTDLRTGAFVVAIRRVSEAARLRGLH